MLRFRAFARWLLGCGLLLLVRPGLATDTAWETLRPGLEYSRIRLGDPGLNGGLHLFRIDLAQHTIALALARDYGVPNASVRDLAQRSHALVAVNGGFFSPDFTPLGLRLSRGVIKAPLKSVSWWSVFAVTPTGAQMVPPSQFRPAPDMTMAIQSGPRLLVNGAIPPLKDGEAERSALCLTAKGRLILAVTENAPVTTEALAGVLRKSARQGGAECIYAQNLDGGGSAQLFATVGKFQVHVPNLSNVSDAVVVLPKSH